MEIRNYIKEDINNIKYLGSLLHDNYNFNIDSFSDAFVIYDNNRFIGFIVYSIIYERAEIIDIVIEPSYRKKGYANKLLEYTIEKIKENSCDNITLEVNENNISAINLYKKNGFNICAVRKNYYNNQDGYLMKKDLR